MATGTPGKKMVFGGGDKCEACSKTVYSTEKITADGHIWHKACFRCTHCNRVLTMQNYTRHEGRLYCRPHFKELFKLKGDYTSGFSGSPVASTPPPPSSSQPSAPQETKTPVAARKTLFEGGKQTGTSVTTGPTVTGRRKSLLEADEDPLSKYRASKSVESVDDAGVPVVTPVKRTAQEDEGDPLARYRASNRPQEAEVDWNAAVKAVTGTRKSTVTLEGEESVSAVHQAAVVVAREEEKEKEPATTNSTEDKKETEEKTEEKKETTEETKAKEEKKKTTEEEKTKEETQKETTHRVKRTIEWKGDGQTVALTGTFTAWGDPIPLQLIASESVFRATVDLEPGRHEFKFIVDGTWRWDPDQETTTDSSGNVNNLLVV